MRDCFCRGFPFFFALLVTLFSLVVFPGYSVFILDHEVYVSAIYRGLGVADYTGDLVMWNNSSNSTLFDEFIVFMLGATGIGIFWAFFLLALVSRLIFFYAIYRLALFFSGDRGFSIFSMLLFLSGAMVFGTYSQTLDIILLPRGISIPLCLLSLAFFLEGRRLYSAVLLGAAILFHFVTCLPFIAFFYFNLFFSRKQLKISGNFAVFLAAVPALFFCVLFLFSTPISDGIFSVIDEHWELLFRIMIPPLFITSWFNMTRWSIFFSIFELLASYAMFSIAMLELRGFFKDRMKMLFICELFLIPVILFAVSFIFVDLLKILFFAILRLTRSLLVWKILIPLLFSFYAFRRIRKSPRDSFANFLLAGTILSFAFKETFNLFFLPAFFVVWASERLHFPKTSVVLAALAVFAFSCACGIAVLLLNNSPDLFASLAVVLLASAALAIAISLFSAGKLLSPRHFAALTAVLALSIAFFLPAFSIMPPYLKNKELAAACNWIIANTDKNSIFQAEPFSDYNVSNVLRLGCQRRVYFSYWGDVFALNSRDSALEWEMRMIDSNSLIMSPAAIPGYAKARGIDFVFSEKPLDFGRQPVFENGKYFIYDVR